MTYVCLLCGRNKFTNKSSHKCLSGFRKRGLRWAILYGIGLWKLKKIK